MGVRKLRGACALQSSFDCVLAEVCVGQPVVLVGDFNADSGVISYLVSVRFMFQLASFDTRMKSP